MSELTTVIGNQIKKNRERLGLTKKALSSMLGVVPATVSGWENGDYAPGVDTLVRLCELFKITLDEIYGAEKKLATPKWNDEQAQENVKLFMELSSEERQEALKYMRYLKRERGIN